MENLRSPERDHPPIASEIPAIEIFNDPAKTLELWNNPELAAQVKRRSRLAESITTYLDLPNPTPDQRAEYFSAGAELLSDPDNRRLTLYWPLDDLRTATPEFKTTYIDAWQSMLFTRDVRENFHTGDVYEPEARSADLNRVVKAAHLIPWLLKSEFVSPDNIIDLVDHSDDPVLKKSIADTIPLLQDWQLFDEDSFQCLDHALADVSRGREEESPPLFESVARRAWLASKDAPEQLADSSANLSGPFSQNIPNFNSELQHVKSLIPDDTLALVGGSRLKGYGATTSDLDIFTYGHGDTSALVEQFDSHPLPNNSVADPELAHIVFNTVWLGSDSTLAQSRADLIAPYLELEEGTQRDQCLERLELDLLAYRLLHKGFKRTHENVSPETQQYDLIDGSSAFYDPRYRRIATKLFAKYVFIPRA